MSDTGKGSASWNVALISRQYIVWKGLQRILEGAEAGRIVVQLYPQVPLSPLLIKNPPDLFLLDLGLQRDPRGPIRRIRETAPNTKIIVMSRVDDMDPMHRVVEYGVDGVILNAQPPAVVMAVIKALNLPLPQSLLCRGYESERGKTGKFVQDQLASEPHPPLWADVLTRREQEVGRLVSQGYSNKEIARQLSISDSTVRHHLTSIYSKIGVPNRQKLLLRIQHDRVQLSRRTSDATNYHDPPFLAGL